MKQLFVAGNWKMRLNSRQSIRLAGRLREHVGDVTDVRIAVCPPFVYLKSVAELLSECSIDVGAQNMHAEEAGAFTGEVAGPMLLDVGCRYVILGHSERRHVFGETDEFINQKVLKAISLGLEPIVCGGETLSQREAVRTESVVSDQLKSALAGVTAEQMAKVTIAYEPVWAIGTGRTATPQQAEQVHALLRALLTEMYDADVSAGTVIQYGGSVKPENTAELMAMPNVDGALVGGASLEAASFEGIIRAAQSAKK